MKRWIFSVLFSIFLGYPAVSCVAADVPDIGKGILLDFEFFRLPIGAIPDSNAAKEKKGEGEIRNGEKQEKILDKKVDDAIKKAWEEE